MTKEIDFVMPYGVTMRGKGDMVPEIVGEHEKKVNVVAIALPAGPCRIAASWDGPQSVTIRVYSGGRFRSVIAEIPSGGGALHHGLLWCCPGGLGADGHVRYRYPGSARDARSVPTRSRVTHQVGAVV